jgi:hypothetical protein
MLCDPLPAIRVDHAIDVQCVLPKSCSHTNPFDRIARRLKITPETFATFALL